MRAGVVLVPLLFSAAPCLSQTISRDAAPASKVIRLPAELSDPASADKLTDSMRSLATALLDIRVGNLHAAIQGREPARGERNMTLRELARRSDPDFDRHLQQHISEARPKIEKGIHAVNDALPKVTADLVRAQKAIERALANMPDPNYPRR
jgi:hypothetical protein